MQCPVWMKLWTPHKKASSPSGWVDIGGVVLLKSCRTHGRCFLTAHNGWSVMLDIEKRWSGWLNSVPAVSEAPYTFCSGRSGQVPMLQQDSLETCQGGVCINPHRHGICLALCGAEPSQHSDLWLGLEPAKGRILNLAWICLCTYIMTEKENSLQASMSQNKNTVKVSWAQPWDDVILSTRSSLELPDWPEGLSAKSQEKMPAGKPPTDTPAGFSKQLELQCLTLSSRHSCRA